jgi:RNA polymerase sigma-70 factor (ECF subfamily)
MLNGVNCYKIVVIGVTFQLVLYLISEEQYFMNIALKSKNLNPGLTDEDIIGEILAGNVEMFSRIIKKYNQRLYRIIRAYGINDSDSEDIMQVAYIKAYKNLDTFQYKSKFSTWLTRILINECLFHLRKRKSPEGNLTLLNNFEEGRYNNSSESDFIKEEIRMILEKAIEELPEKYRVVFMMKEIEELTGKETADILGLSESNVRVLLHRAKKMLRLDLNNKLGEKDVFEFGNDRCAKLAERVMATLNDYAH